MVTYIRCHGSGISHEFVKLVKHNVVYCTRCG